MLEIQLNASNARKTLGRLHARLEDPRPAMAAIGEYLRLRTDERFVGQHNPEGHPWKPLAARTIHKKKNPKILQEHGHLRDRIHVRATRNEVTLSSRLIYAAIQQLGGQAGRGRKVTIPARPYLGVNAEDRKEFAAIYRDFLKGGI